MAAWVLPVDTQHSQDPGNLPVDGFAGLTAQGVQAATLCHHGMGVARLQHVRKRLPRGAGMVVCLQDRGIPVVLPRWL